MSFSGPKNQKPRSLFRGTGVPSGWASFRLLLQLLSLVPRRGLLVALFAPDTMADGIHRDGGVLRSLRAANTRTHVDDGRGFDRDWRVRDVAGEGHGRRTSNEGIVGDRAIRPVERVNR